MTRQRLYGIDTPFGQWLRCQAELDSHQQSFTANDVDWIFTKYRTPCDINGTREVQLMMNVEVKTFGAKPNDQQRETLFMQHQLLCMIGKQKKVKRVDNRGSTALWHMGCYVLVFPSSGPNNDEPFEWGVFRSDGVIDYWLSGVPSFRLLTNLLSFKIKSHKPTELIDFRRHHKKSSLIVSETTELGFVIEREVRFRS